MRGTKRRASSSHQTGRVTHDAVLPIVPSTVGKELRQRGRDQKHILRQYLLQWPDIALNDAAIEVRDQCFELAIIATDNAAEIAALRDVAFNLRKMFFR